MSTVQILGAGTVSEALVNYARKEIKSKTLGAVLSDGAIRMAREKYEKVYGPGTSQAVVDVWKEISLMIKGYLLPLVIVLITKGVDSPGSHVATIATATKKLLEMLEIFAKEEDPEKKRKKTRKKLKSAPNKSAGAQDSVGARIRMNHAMTIGGSSKQVVGIRRATQAAALGRSRRSAYRSASKTGRQNKSVKTGDVQSMLGIPSRPAAASLTPLAPTRAPSTPKAVTPLQGPKAPSADVPLQKGQPTPGDPVSAPPAETAALEAQPQTTTPEPSISPDVSGGAPADPTGAPDTSNLPTDTPLEAVPDAPPVDLVGAPEESSSDPGTTDSSNIDPGSDVDPGTEAGAPSLMELITMGEDIGESGTMALDIDIMTGDWSMADEGMESLSTEEGGDAGITGDESGLGAEGGTSLGGTRSPVVASGTATGGEAGISGGESGGVGGGGDAGIGGGGATTGGDSGGGITGGSAGGSDGGSVGGGAGGDAGGSAGGGSAGGGSAGGGGGGGGA